MNGFIIYLLSIAEGVKGVLLVLSAVSLIVTMCIGALCNYDDDFKPKNPEKKKLFWESWRMALACSICAMFLALLIPDVKTIVTLHVANSIANSDTVSKGVPELTKLGIEALKKNLEEKK